MYKFPFASRANPLGAYPIRITKTKVKHTIHFSRSGRASIACATCSCLSVTSICRHGSILENDSDSVSCSFTEVHVSVCLENTSPWVYPHTCSKSQNNNNIPLSSEALAGKYSPLYPAKPFPATNVAMPSDPTLYTR